MLRALGISVLRGGDFDRWDLGIRGGLFGSARLMMAVEDTGQGTQFVRFRAWPRCSTFGPVVVAALIVLGSLAAATDACWVASAGLVAAAALVAARCLHECAVAMGAVLHVLEAQLREGA
jgi:hypothetical protein